MFKAIINDNGEQRLVKYHPSGGVKGPHVVWDERKDGPIPRDMIGNIGYLKRENDRVVVDETLKKEYERKKLAKEQNETRIKEITQALPARLKAKTATLEEINEYLYLKFFS